ncbi:MAG: 23S rRNA (adenine(2503)-C(2))-methyltransferase RlmN [Gemmataceae bacterium]
MELPTIQTPQPEAKRTAILDLSVNQLREWFAERDQPVLRVKQVRRWLVEVGVQSFDQMTDLPKALRLELNENFALFGNSVARHLTANDNTHKLLVKLPDEKLVECVLIQDGGRRTACISTQVGCGMGCVFCASGLNGVERNLTVGEILEQLLRLRNIPRPAGDKSERLSHIVVMGMGEPLANLDALVEVLDIATAKTGLGMSARHITISTVGLPPKIRRLADLGKQYHLAVSLHAPNDDLRTEIVPTNVKTGISDILDAAQYFFNKTGRQVTYEYVLLRELNDRPQHARELARLLRGRGAHVNLIPFNNVDGLPYHRPTQEAQTVFVNTLRSAGISVKVRKRKGSEIDAACGQLRRKVAEQLA